MKDSTKNWLNFAKTDLDAAEELLKNENFTNIVSFLSQQSIEKTLKAVLEENNIKIPRTHKIQILYTMLPEDLIELLRLEKEIIYLIDSVYIDSRYPSDIGLLPEGIPSISQAKELLKIAFVYSTIQTYLENK